jgi:hypothetical protein
VDSIKERDQLERFSRRRLIPYIDIGMDVHVLGGGEYLVSGQVILSMPGRTCLRCCGFVTHERLAREAERYGDAGSRPQVIWSNGVLASTAVGLVTQVLTAWFKAPSHFVYLGYDGNRGTLVANDRMELLQMKVCPHHPADETGDPFFDAREYCKGVVEREAQQIAPTVAGLKAHRWRRILRCLFRVSPRDPSVRARDKAAMGQAARREARQKLAPQFQQPLIGFLTGGRDDLIPSREQPQ